MGLFVLMITVTVDASDLLIQIDGISTEKGGRILVGLYDSEDGYLEYGTQFAVIILNITDESISGEFSDLPPGLYAVSVLHDLDGNGEMETGFLGIPKEGYGFSGSEIAQKRPPKFKEAAVSLGENDRRSIVISMNYM